MVQAAKLPPLRAAVQQQERVPAPVGGLNYTDNTMSMPPTDAYLMDNFIPRPFGVEIRRGWRHWIPEANALPGEVRSIMVFNTRRDEYSAVLAGCSDSTSSVYNVTQSNTAPTISYTPTKQPAIVGEFYWTEYVTPGGSFLCVVAYGMGYTTCAADAIGTLVWTEVAVGSSPGQLEFPTDDTTPITDLCFCWVWQNRLWFLKKNSAVAYYLPVGQITGKLAAFDFGPQLTRGGALNWATRWTYDSGQGMDDSLVLVSVEGDCLVYTGTDPSSADAFKLKGVWFIGRGPYGRRNFCQHGGDLLVINEYGLIRISDLVAGRLHTSTLSGDLGAKVNPRLAGIVTSVIDEKYWFLTPLPSEELLILGSPWYNDTTGIRQSFAMNSVTTAWSTLSNMNMVDADVYRGRLIFGTREGFVCEGFTGYQDNVPSDGSTVGDEVTARLQTAFLDYGKSTANKRMLRTKIYGLSETSPSIRAVFKAEYNLNELLSTPAPTAQGTVAWDVAMWDDSIWNASVGSFHRWIGVAAYGKKMSLQLAVRGSGRTVLTDYEVLFETGIGL
jgi:hypothetical protein